jgi:hypothetical protein
MGLLSSIFSLLGLIVLFCIVSFDLLPFLFAFLLDFIVAFSLFSVCVISVGLHLALLVVFSFTILGILCHSAFVFHWVVPFRFSWDFVLDCLIVCGLV